MKDESTIPETEEIKDGSSGEDPWREVGRQFQELGESLAETFKTFWNDEDVRRQAAEMKTGLESLVKNVSEAVQETVRSPEVQQAREEAAKAAQDVRPHLLNALRQVNQELQKLIQRMEQAGPGAEEGEASKSPDEAV